MVSVEARRVPIGREEASSVAFCCPSFGASKVLGVTFCLERLLEKLHRIEVTRIEVKLVG